MPAFSLRFVKLISLLLLLALPSTLFARKRTGELIDSLIHALPKTDVDTIRIQILATISNSYWLDTPDKGIEYGLQALALAEKTGWKRGIAGSNFALALNYRFKGEYAKALERCQQSLAVWTQLDKKKKIGEVYFTMCMIYIDESSYPQALEYGLKSLSTAESIGDSIYLCRDLTNIGIIYEDLGNHQKALEFHNRAMRIYEIQRDSSGIAIGLSNIALVYKGEGDYRKAVQMNFEAMAINERERNTLSVAKNLGDIGDAYKEMKEYSKALEYLFKALKINQDKENKAGAAEKLQNIGETYLAIASDSVHKTKEDGLISGSRQQNLQSAINYLSQAAAIHKDIGNIKDLSENYHDLATAEQLSGNYKDALQNHLLYTASRDSFSSLERNRQVSELETKYETKEKDRQIASQNRLIAYDRKINLSLALCSCLFLALGIIVFVNQRKTSRLNKLITTQKTELERLNAVKDRIFSVISHDLRTPVNSLVSFTQLLEHGNIPPEKLEKYAVVLKENLGYTASLMENLLNWARTQMQGYKPVFEKFDVAETAALTVGLLAPEAGKKNVHLANNIARDTIVFADMNMTSLLIRNLLSNAIKYTPAGGTITLSAQADQYTVKIEVNDTGVGIARALVDEFNNSLTDQPLYSTPGTNKEKGTGLGLMLCKGFAALMHGRITLRSEPGKGSSFTVELPA